MQNKRTIEYDFIKGFAIISVILLHTLDEYLIPFGAFFHIWQAVPLFVLVSFILLYKKLEKINIREYYSKKSLINLLKKIILPFLLVEILILLILSLTQNFHELPMSYKALGAGPGAYYPFIYLQIWFITPVFYYVLNSSKKSARGIGYILLIIIVLTILTTLYLKEDFIYKRFFLRYAFLGILAWMWLKNKNVKLIIPFAIISLLYYMAVTYFSFSFEPFFDSRWNTQQLPAFFYTFLLFAILWNLCKYFYKISPRFTKFLLWCGENSYEIFLLQMFWLTFLGDWQNVVTENFTRVGYIMLVFTLSLLPVLIFKTLRVKISTLRVSNI